MSTRPFFFAALLAVALLTTTPPAWSQVGHTMSGVGPVDQAWSGAGTAIPQDALGALYWNPAGITSLEATSLSISLQVLKPNGTIYSSVSQNAFGPGFPGATVAGTTTNDAGVFPIPSVGFVHAPATSRWAFGVSAFGVGGFGVDFASESDNPITTPAPPGGFGMGAMNSAFQLLQVAPAVAYRLSGNVSIGVAPTLNLSTLEVGPFPATYPDDANGDGYPSYPEGPQATALGYGFQVGLHVDDLQGFLVGASYKSTQQFEDFAFDAEDEMGGGRTFAFNLDYPSILSFGIGYSGLENWIFAADVRYIDFGHTDGFEDVGFDQTGAVKGFGWSSITTVAAGVQYALTDRMPVRLGYSFNENPISDANTFFNCVSPAIIQHRLSGGLSYDISRAVTGSLAIQYGFKNAIEGNWQHPLMGAMPPTMVKSEMSTLFFVFGFDVKL